MKIRRIKRRRIRPKRLIRTAGWFLVLLGMLLVYSVKIEPNLLLVRHYQLQGNCQAQKPFVWHRFLIFKLVKIIP